MSKTAAQLRRDPFNEIGIGKTICALHLIHPGGGVREHFVEKEIGDDVRRKWEKAVHRCKINSGRIAVIPFVDIFGNACSFMAQHFASVYVAVDIIGPHVHGATLRKEIAQAEDDAKEPSGFNR